MMNSSSFKQKLCKTPFIDMLTYVIDNSESNKGNKLMVEQFRSASLQVAESLAKHNKVLFAHH